MATRLRRTAGKVRTGVWRNALSWLLIAVWAAADVSAAPDVGLHGFTAEQLSHWAFQPVARPDVPTLPDSGWVTNPIDSFVLEGLRANQLEPGEAAGRVALLRRAYFDLLGLPPSVEAAREFLGDRSPRAYENLLDRLLASPHYGERWGRHWLDVARFAESSGFETDVTRPNAWRYRDYVIASFNSDKPYDRFVMEQIAGDELWPDSTDARIATAFNRHYPEEGNQKDLLLARQQTLHDITHAVGSTFLGLTVGCAQCHDHKFDPISQRDYYRLQAFFANVNHDDYFPLVPDGELREYEASLARWEGRTAAIWDEMSDLLMPLRNFTPDQLLSRYPDYVIDAVGLPAAQRTASQAWIVDLLETKTCGTCPLRPKPYRDPQFLRVSNKLKGPDKDRFEELQGKLAALSHLKPAEIPRGLGVRDISETAPPTHVLGMGLHDRPGEEVQPGFPSVLDTTPAIISKPPQGGSTGRRSALAGWLADPGNPLTARVMVNRIWHHHFGTGLVSTPGDFGLMGDRPSNPRLLDWLGAEFVSSGWSLKHLHRLIMSSSTYRQGPGRREHRNPAEADARVGPEVDPRNRLLWRYPQRRLEGEALRDSALSVAGLLNASAGGPSVFPPLPRGTLKPPGGWQVEDSEWGHRRRSIYVFVRRNSPYPMLELFDFPDTHESCSRRSQTTTAPQALALLNGEEPVAWGRAFARRVLARAGNDAGQQVDEAFRLAYSRLPDPVERDAALTFLERQADVIAEDAPRSREGPTEAVASAIPASQLDALSDFCLMLLNANEFAYRM